MYGDEAITTGCMSPKKQSCGGTDAYVAGLSRYWVEWLQLESQYVEFKYGPKMN